jgi:hypothetical protein
VTEDLDERYAGGPPSTAKNPFGSTPVHVPSLGAASKAQLLEDLEKWVEELARRFVVDIRTIPPCWTRHNAMVETLTALRDYERGCYVGTAPPTAAMEWIRALRDGIAFMHDLASLTQCSAREHRPDPQRPST